MTVILKSEEPQLITLKASVAMVKALKKMGVKAEIKWPNDILVKGKKVCGILGEAYENFVLLGIGLNLENEIPEELREIAINLPNIQRDAFLPLFLEILEKELKKGRKDILEEWRKYQCTLGRKVIVDEELQGVAEDIDEEGFLILNTGGERKRIMAGTLRFLE